jgi:hypothetical protein
MRVMRDGTEIEITGGMKYGLSDDFRRVIAAAPRLRVVHLNSIGGRIGEAEKLHKIIKEKGFITYTSNPAFLLAPLHSLPVVNAGSAAVPNLDFTKVHSPGCNSSLQKIS